MVSNPEQCNVSKGIAKAAVFYNIIAVQSENAACDRLQKRISTEAYKPLQCCIVGCIMSLLQKAAAVAVSAVVKDSLVDLQADFSSSLAACIMSSIYTCTSRRNCQDSCLDS